MMASFITIMLYFSNYHDSRINKKGNKKMQIYNHIKVKPISGAMGAEVFDVDLSGEQIGRAHV